MSTDAEPLAVDSSTAAPAPPATLGDYSKEQYANWRLTGDPDISAPSADSPPASVSETPASTDAIPPAASEPAKPLKKNLESRKAELDRENQDLRDRLKLRAQLREELATTAPAPRGDAPLPASSPAPVPDLAHVLQAPNVNRPVATEDEFFSVYPDAKYGEYGRYVARYEIVAEQARTTAQQSHQTRVQETTARANQFAQHYQAAVTADPTFPDTLAPWIREATPTDALGPGQPLTPANVIAQEILISSIPTQIMSYLSAHDDVAQQLLALPTPEAIVRSLGKLEGQLTAGQKPSLTSVPKTTSTAPAPPTTLGTNATVPADEVDRAVATGDFRRYMRAANRRDVAATG